MNLDVKTIKRIELIKVINIGYTPKITQMKVPYNTTPCDNQVEFAKYKFCHKFLEMLSDKYR